MCASSPMMQIESSNINGSIKCFRDIYLLICHINNILKLHFKIQKGRLGTALKVPQSFPAGL